MRSNAKNLMLLILLPFMITACQLNLPPSPYTLERSIEVPPLKHPAWTTYSYNGRVNDMAFDANGNLWTTSPRGGVTHWDLPAKTYVQYTPEHGVADIDMGVISIAPDGGVWASGDMLGSAERIGLSHFDGETWTTYTTTGEIPIGRIASIAAGPNHTVWASGDGIYHFDGNAWTTYEQDSFVHAIELASDGTIWSELDAGLARFDGDTWQLYDGAPEYMRDIAVAEDGTLWVIAGFSEIWYFDGRAWQTYSEDNDKMPSGPCQIAVNSEGIVWVGGYNGIARFNGTSWKFYETIKVDAMAIRDDDSLWISNYRYPGIFRFDGELRENRTLATEAPFQKELTYFTRAMFAANNDEIWITFGNEAGIYRHDNHLQGNAAWTSYAAKVGLYQPVMSIQMASDQSMWFSTGREIVSFDGQQWKTELSQHIVIEHFAIMENGDIWVVNRNEVSRFDGLDWHIIDTPFSVKNSNISTVATAAGLGLFVGTRDGDVYYYDQEEWVPIYTTSSIDSSPPSIGPITIQDDHVWVGIGGLGIFKFAITPTTEYWPYEHYQIEEGLPSNAVSAIAVSPLDNTIWIGTDSGIASFDGTTWLVYTTDNGLASNHVSEIAVLSDGTVWVAVAGGFSIFTPPAHD